MFRSGKHRPIGTRFYDAVSEEDRVDLDLADFDVIGLDRESDVKKAIAYLLDLAVQQEHLVEDNPIYIAMQKSLD